MPELRRLPGHVTHWFSQRSLPVDVLKVNGISWDVLTNRIAIPIRDESGSILFYKYRRDPESTDGPKYSYDSGAKRALFGIEYIKYAKNIVVAEGELDALLLRTKGFFSVSSTGGAGTWDDSWSKLLTDKEVYVCFDLDEAGIKGALNLLRSLPTAKMVVLPEKVGKSGDVTDYFCKLNKTADDFRELLSTGSTYYVPPKVIDLPEDVKEIKKLVAKIKVEADRIMRLKHETSNAGLFVKHLEALCDIYKVGKEEYEKQIDRLSFKGANPNIGLDIEVAKMVAIDTFINFNNAHFAICLWHEEKTPSMFYYRKTNKVKCFGCGKSGDVIDIIQKIHNLSFTDALRFLLEGNKK